MKECLYEKIGCKFLHSDSEMCKFKENYNKKVCQFKHLDDDDKEVEEIIFKCVKCEHEFKTKNKLSNHGKTH